MGGVTGDVAGSICERPPENRTDNFDYAHILRSPMDETGLLGDEKEGSTRVSRAERSCWTALTGT